MINWIFGRFAPAERRTMPVFALFSVAMLSLRAFLAWPFWLSGQTRWVEFPTQLASSTKYLFENEFRLHFGLFDIPVPFALFVAHMTALAEIILPILLIFGLLSRFSALALLAMTLVIELVFPDAWPIHIQWALAAALIVYFGPGLFSIDALIRRVAPSNLGNAAV